MKTKLARLLWGIVILTLLLAPFPGKIAASPPRQGEPPWNLQWFLSIESITDLAYSPDGSTLAVASRAGVRLCAPNLDIVDATYMPYEVEATALAWSPNSQYLVVGRRDYGIGYHPAEPAFQHINVADGEQWSGGTLENDDDAILAVDYAPDGETIAYGHGDILDLPQLDIRLDTGAPVTSVDWSPDGSRLATPGQIWDTTTWTVMGEFEGRGVVRWSPNGTWLATIDSTGRKVGIWDAHALSRLITLSGHKARINTLAWSPDGTQLVTGSDDETMRIWDATTGTQIAVLPQEASVRTVAWSPDGKTIASGLDNPKMRRFKNGIVVTWNAQTGTQMNRLNGTGVYEETMAWSPDGTRLASADGGVSIWDGSTGQLRRRLYGPLGLITNVYWSPDGSLLAVQSNYRLGPVWIYNPATGEHLSTLGDFTFRTRISGSWSPDSTRYATGREDGTLVIYNATSGQELMTIPAYEANEYRAFMTVKWSPDGTRLASIGEEFPQRVLMWDAATGDLLAELPADSDAYYAVWSPGGARLAYQGVDENNESNLTIYDVLTGEQIVIDTSFRELAWSPDGNYLVTWWEKDCRGTTQQVRVFDSHTGEPFLIIDSTIEAWIDFVKWTRDTIHVTICRQMNFVAYSPDGTRWAIMDFGIISVWSH